MDTHLPVPLALYRCASYDPEVLGPIVRQCLSFAPISRGSSVLVKANMISARAPERSVTTHPAVVESVCRALLDMDCRPFIGDSPGMEPFDKIARISGIADVGKRLGVEVRELSRSTLCPPSPRRVNQRLELSADALGADAIVNLPKLKTHCQMQLTLAVKNLFGTVVGQRKAQWHYAVGLDRSRFANVMLDILQSLPPVFSILDGVMGMDGRGPTNGTPHAFGMIAACTDPVALDSACCTLLGVNPDDYALCRAARLRNIGDPGLANIEWRGDMPPQTRFENVDMPELHALNLAPRFLDRITGRLLSSRPFQVKNRCIACGRCAQICPADALRLERGTLRFDYDKCIRCYCCQEMCPADAIGFRESTLMKIISRIKER